MTNKNPLYTATLELSQDSLDGPIKTRLAFNPLVTSGDDTVPSCFEAMSGLFEVFLMMNGIIDKDGNVIDEDELHATVNINASKFGNVH